MIHVARMTRWLLSLLIVMTFLFMAASDAQAFGKRGRIRRARRPAPSYAETYHRLNSAAPKYYYGFHSSYMYNMGIPSGDIGLRGNGVFMTPW